MADEKSPKARRRDFQDVLTDIDEGRFHEQLTEVWPRVVKACLETRKAGSLTITLAVETDSDRTVLVKPKCSTKMPTKGAHASIFFTDEEGGTHKNDPKQQTFKVVQMPKPT